MPDKFPTNSTSHVGRSPTAHARARHAIAGAAAGALLWASLLLLGIPRIAGLENAGDFTIPAMLLGAIFALTRLRRVVYVKAAVLGLFVALIAYTPLIERPYRSLVRADAPPVVPSGAVVVLGGDVTPDGLLAGQSLDRMLTGVALVKEGTAPLLVISGNTVDARGRAVSARADQEQLIRLAGIAPSAVVVADRVHSTRDEAVRASALLRQKGIRRIHVVTSPSHTGRACRTFERVGFVVTCTPSTARDVPASPRDLYRSADRLEAFGWWAYERAAMALYHMKGWI